MFLGFLLNDIVTLSILVINGYSSGNIAFKSSKSRFKLKRKSTAVQRIT